MEENNVQEVTTNINYTQAENPKETLESSTDLIIGGTEDQKVKMFEALSKYYSEVQNPENTTTNTFFKAKYAPLNEVLNTIRPIMGKYGFACTQATGVDNGDCFVSTLLTHSSGAYIYYPTLRGKPAKQDIQGVGATLTYLRRFTLNAVAGVAGEVDDDGNAGSTKPQEKPKPPERKDVDDVFDKIATQIQTLTDGGTDKTLISETIKTNCVVDGKNTANYRKIKEVDDANKVLDALIEIGGNK